MLTEHQLVLTDVIVDELREGIGRKRPNLLPELETFLAGIDYELAHHADSPIPISDPNGQPILDAALASTVDVIVTGDKAYLSLTIEQPRTMTARAFLDAYSGSA